MKKHCDDTCENCIYIGEGDFICDAMKNPEIVIDEWVPLYSYCPLEEENK